MKKFAHDGPAMIYRATLLRRPGWTETALERFLPQCDKSVPNPHYKSGPPSSLYLLSRIEEIERTPEFQEWLKEAQPRKARASAAAPKATATKRQKMLDWIDALTVDIKPRPLDQIREQAVQNHAIRAWERGRETSYQDAPQEFLDRITVNFLRHCTTAYERLLDETWGKVGAENAYGLIRARVLAAIADAYPELQSECERQVKKMGDRAAELVYHAKLKSFLGNVQDRQQQLFEGVSQ
jgi:hypothetical protein